MRAVVLPLALALAVLLPLSGCVGSDTVEEPGGTETGTGEPGDPQDPEVPAAPDAKSIVQGKVLRFSFEPIEGATVRVAQDGKIVQEATTDAQGRYEIKDLEPKASRVQVAAACCKTVSYQVNLRAGETHTLDAQLEPYQSVVPYVEEDSRTGMVGCSGYFPVVGIFFNPEGACAETDPNNDPFHDFELHANLQTVVVAMEWEAVLTNPTGALQLIMTNTTALSSDQRYFTLNGESPLEITLGPDDPEGGPQLSFRTIYESRDSRFTVIAGDPAGFAYQQPFTVHWEFYYHEPAPPDASALPDA